MSDLIDRQAVIDALHTWFRDGFDEDKWWNSTHVLAAIEGVPPAQLGTNLAEVGTRAVRGYPIDADALMEKVAEEYGERARDRLYQIIRYMPPAQPDCAKCKSELANKIRGQQDNPGMLTENDKGRNWGLEWAAQIVEGKRR